MEVNDMIIYIKIWYNLQKHNLNQSELSNSIDNEINIQK